MVSYAFFFSRGKRTRPKPLIAESAHLLPCPLFPSQPSTSRPSRHLALHLALSSSHSHPRPFTLSISPSRFPMPSCCSPFAIRTNVKHLSLSRVAKENKFTE